MKRIFRYILAGGFILTLQSCFLGKSKTMDPSSASAPSVSFYTLSLKSLDGKTDLKFSDFKGKKVLIVNTASKCGYTPQYEGLQKLHEKYSGKLVILGCPCNQFAGQEPGDSAKIGEFCRTNYKINFLMTEKLNVKGDEQHAVYRWLTSKSENGSMDATVSWNFNKFLINEEGLLTHYFPSNIEPENAELTSAIEK
jgi:glutathione peroxidase